MSHVMIDLETMDTRPSAAITAIGGAVFNLELGVYETFYERVELSTRYGGTMSPDTIKWWLKQSDEARAEVTKGGPELPDALGSLSFFFQEHGVTHVWGNGAPFDNVILSESYQNCGLEVPWKFFNDRCYRTIKSLFPDVPRVKPLIPHHAMHDAVAQAQHLVNIFRAKGLELK